MTGPTNARPSGLLFCNLLLLLATAVYLIFGTSLIKLPQNTTSMFPNYSYGNTGSLKKLFPEQKGKKLFPERKADSLKKPFPKRKGRPPKMLYWAKLPQNTTSMFPDYSYGNADSLKTIFPERKGRPIKMLYWTALFGGVADWTLQTGIKNGCPELSKTCKFTIDHTQYNDSDVILFHIRSSYRFPKYRLRFQKWVFAIMESPVHTYRSMSRERWMYNITMTYKQDSDVTFFCGECRRKTAEPATSHVKYNYAHGKKHLIAWFVSNCNTSSKREVYVRELAKHIDVHKFGCGGKYSCPHTKNNYCDAVLLNHTYKFYLSFENSLCTDYATEKVYRILNVNVVPIVLGYSNYSSFLPPHSFIDVRDFDSPKKLAAYLKMLNENDTEYNRYFAWRQTHTCADLPARNTACKLCRYAHRHRQRIQVADVLQFWGRKTNCINAKQFYGDRISV